MIVDRECDWDRVDRCLRGKEGFGGKGVES